METKFTVTFITKSELSDFEQVIESKLKEICDLDVCHVQKRKNRKNERELFKIKEFTPEEAFDLMGHPEGGTKRKVSLVVDGKTFNIRTHSYRYPVFKRSLECACCGLLGTKMILELASNDINPHFNLYGEEFGNLVLFTVDHILPKSQGGTDKKDNLQTMCAICNNIKSDSLDSLDEVRKFRQIYKDNYYKLSNRRIWKLIASHKLVNQNDKP